MDKKQEIREAAEADLEVFINLVHPQRFLGDIHKELIEWWARPSSKSHQLVLLPRDHGKSAMVGYRVAWEITRNPKVRVLYISSTSNLATKQLKFIKDILTSDIYRRYWPEMVNVEESKREKWTETEISIDHPIRKAEAIRDPTVFTAGLTTNIVGLHCDIAVMDDVVTGDNAYTEEGRKRVQTQYSLLSSIEGADSSEWVVGTRYHPKDLYNDMLEMNIDQFDEEGSVVGSVALYEIFERKVENSPGKDLTGEYLWPRAQRSDGVWFGFNTEVMAKKKAQYLDRLQFRAQYYNDPNDPEGAGIKREFFQYYDKAHVTRQDGKWFVKGARVNLTAAMDFAYSTSLKADYSTIMVIGTDYENNIYVLDVDRFRTTDLYEYFKRMLALHQKWDFRKMIAETSLAQEVIVKSMRDYVSQHGLALSIEPYKPSRHQGAKEERIEAALQPRYANYQMWHYRGGLCSLLEEELVMQNPPHDDLKDVLSIAVQHAIKPASVGSTRKSDQLFTQYAHSRFGGI